MMRSPNGSVVLSDFEPAVGQVVSWKPKSGKARIYLFEKRATVSRELGCVFFRGSGERVHEFWRG